LNHIKQLSLSQLECKNHEALANLLIPLSLLYLPLQ
jgi:hypothetical protein